MTIRFEDRVAVITGAGAGLGRSHALLLARLGAKVVVNDPGRSRSADRPSADEVVDEIRAAGGEAIANHSSVADPESAHALIAQAIEAWGRIDILINNAGILRDKSFVKADMDDFEQVLKVHLLGSAYCTHAAWPHMRAAGFGRVVMITSNAGLYGNFGQSNYAAAKTGMLGLMNTLVLEGAKYGIGVNCIAPVALTPMTENVLPTEIARHFDPAHVSAAVALLCSADFTESGVILSAAAGHYATARIACSRGIQLDPSATASPDALLDRWNEITDTAGERTFPNAGAETEAILEAIKTLART
ncbi:MAG: Dehydrogenase [Rhodobacteraceae bacterium HLUCCA12]|nr:MAG: Dehydrogenase [Rhodobacteraceae bacterium HLUCCA12]